MWKGTFEIHHIDGDNKNWKRDNLKIVCLNCHWKTSNYRMRNKQQKENSMKKMVQTTKSKYGKFITNGIVNRRLKKDELLPEGWSLGKS